MSKTMADLLVDSGVTIHLYCLVCNEPFIRDYPAGYTGGIKVVCGEICLMRLPEALSSEGGSNLAERNDAQMPSELQGGGE